MLLFGHFHQSDAMLSRLLDVMIDTLYVLRAADFGNVANVYAVTQTSVLQTAIGCYGVLLAPIYVAVPVVITASQDQLTAAIKAAYAAGRADGVDAGTRTTVYNIVDNSQNTVNNPVFNTVTQNIHNSYTTINKYVTVLAPTVVNDNTFLTEIQNFDNPQRPSGDSLQLAFCFAATALHSEYTPFNSMHVLASERNACIFYASMYHCWCQGFDSDILLMYDAGIMSCH